MEDDSTTETESDMDDSRIRIRENPVLDCDESLGNDSSLDVKGADLKGTSPSSSDSEQPYSLKRSKYKGLREPYKLRSGPGQLSPVSEDLIGASSSKMTSSSVVTSAFLTPPLGSHSPVKSSHVSIATSVSSEFKMTPPETPKIQPSNVQSSTADGKNMNRLPVSVSPCLDGLESMLYCKESSRFLRDRFDSETDTSTEPSTPLQVPSTPPATSLPNLDPMMAKSLLTSTHPSLTHERKPSNLLHESRSSTCHSFFSFRLDPSQKSDDPSSPQIHVPVAKDACSSPQAQKTQHNPGPSPPLPSSQPAPGQPQKPKKTKQGQSSRGGAPQTSPGTDSDLVSVTAQALATVTSTSKPLHKKKTSPKVSLKSEGTSKPSHKMKSSPKASLTFEETSKPASHRMKSSQKTSLSSEAAQKVTVKTSARLAARGQEGEASFSKRSFSDSSVLSAAHKSYSGKKRAASVSTRNRAQTMFENVSGVSHLFLHVCSN